MRIHSDTKHKHSWARHYATRPTVLLDQVEVSDVVEADEEEGYVSVHVFAKGSSTPVYANGEYLTEMKFGKVEIIGDKRTDTPSPVAPPVIDPKDLEKVTGV